MKRQNPAAETGLAGGTEDILDAVRLPRKAPRINRIRTSSFLEYVQIFLFGTIFGLLIGAFLGGMR